MPWIPGEGRLSAAGILEQPNKALHWTGIPPWSIRVSELGRCNISNLSRDILRMVEIPLPPLALRREIVSEIEAERALVNTNRKLVEIFERKIQAKLAEIWGEDHCGQPIS